MVDQPARPPHYPTPAAKYADLVIHIVGLVFAVSGGIALLTLSVRNQTAQIAAIAVYAGGMVLMLSFSLAYNFAPESRRRFFRRLDHAGIFLMIAGSYTPFTTTVLKGGWAWGMTTAIWTIAVVGILGKLLVPQLKDWVWVAFYLSMGWLVVFAAGPIVEGLSTPALVLLVIGGLVYTLGVVVYVTELVPYWRSVWHGHVVAAAGVHWAAILIGTVLPTLGN